MGERLGVGAESANHRAIPQTSINGRASPVLPENAIPINGRAPSHRVHVIH